MHYLRIYIRTGIGPNFVLIIKKKSTKSDIGKMGEQNTENHFQHNFYYSIKQINKSSRP